MATDTARRVVVLFGGDRRETSSGATASFRSDTVLFDGIDWTRTGIQGPRERAFHAMAYSAEAGAVVMFGGAQAWLRAPLGDTWLWRGSYWEQSGAGPQARFAHAMAYDEARGRLLLFGGATNASSFLGDTWEFRGNTWRPLNPVHAPSARQGHSMAYDPRRQRVVLMGGLTAGGVVADTWDFDGVDWVQRSTGGPSRRNMHGLATDRARNTVVLFGGSPAAGSRFGDTWELVSTVPHSVTYRGVGCTNSFTPPSIAAEGVPLAGSPDFAIRVSGALPGARVIISLSQSYVERSVFPCMWYLGTPAAPFGLVADGSGQASVRAPVPWLLHGATIYAQGQVVTPNGAALGYDYTRALVITVGD